MIDEKTITKFILKRKKLIILFWLLLCFFLATTYAPHFMDKTRSDLNPPDDSEAGRAYKLQDQYFPEKTNDVTHIVVCQSLEDGILSPEFAIFTSKIVTEMNNSFVHEYVEVVGYYIFHQTLADSIKHQFISHNEMVSIIGFVFKGDLDFQKEITKHLRNFIKSQNLQSFK
ncbi:MAG: hypothetical protein ACXAC7_24000, partial [Candidatus Hodarchaeales archaeon]